jgi:hypothetical protein
MNFLNDYPKVRKYLYLVQWLVNGVFAVLGAYFVATQTPVDALPEWYVVPLAVLPVLWTYLGLQAGANTPASEPGVPPYQGQHARGAAGYAVLGALGLGLIVLSVLLFVLTLLKVVAFSWVVLVVLFVVGLVLVFIDRGGPGRSGRVL